MRMGIRFSTPLSMPWEALHQRDNSYILEPVSRPRTEWLLGTICGVAEPAPLLVMWSETGNTILGDEKKKVELHAGWLITQQGIYSARTDRVD
jgi:hypothetical protein